jgi:hypothetical protein
MKHELNGVSLHCLTVSGTPWRMPTLNDRLATPCEGLRVWLHPKSHNAEMEVPAELQTFKTRTVAEALELHPNTIRSLIKSGELEVVWISKMDQRVTGKSLAKYLEWRKVKPDEEKGGGKVAASSGGRVTENVKSRASQVLERLGLGGKPMSLIPTNLEHRLLNTALTPRSVRARLHTALPPSGSARPAWRGPC